jgi:CelD/BcsL family acetyltransferase involved in cellulose biosynthesis
VSTLRLDVTNSVADLEAMRDDWSRVFAASADRSVFLTWEWVRHWWQRFGGRDRLHVLTVSDGSDLIAIAPMLRTTMGWGPARVTMLVGVGQETAEYGGILLGEQSEQCARLILEHLEWQIASGATVVNFTRLRPDGALLGALDQRYGHGGGSAVLVEAEREVYPRLDFTLVDEPQQHLRKLDKRNDSRRRLRRLSEDFRVRFEYDVEITPETMGELFRLYDARWTQKDAKPSGLFASERGRPFVVDVARELRARGMCRLSMLYADDVPVAGRCGFELEAGYLGYMSAFDPEYSTYGLSTVLVAQILAYELDHGMHFFDFARGSAPHKTRWANAAQEVGYWMLTPPGRGGRFRRRAAWALLSRRSRRFR